MYEFEGLLFSCPIAMHSVLYQSGFQPTVEVWAQGILAQFESNPEKINDSPQTAPSKRLEGNTNYRKTTHGPNIAKQIGMQKLRDVCAGFNDWVTRLERLADKSG